MVSAVVVVALLIIGISSAGTGTVKLEAEDASTSGGRVISDASASGNKAFQFGKFDATEEPGPTHPPTGSANISGVLKKWHKVTLTFNGPSTSESANPNPFTDYRLNVTFTNGSSKMTVPGFYAADGNAAESSSDSGNKWQVNFNPHKTGQWSYEASFRQGSNIAVSTDANAGSAASFNGAKGTFNVANSNKTGDDFRAKGRLQYVGQHHLRFFDSGEYFLKAGTDSPENFLGYGDFDNTKNSHDWAGHSGDWRSSDPTWKGNKGKNIIGAVNYLADQGINSIYFLTYNIDGGDGKDVFMWSSEGDKSRFDVSKLEQWEIVFEHMQKRGVMLHFVTQETENDEKLDGGGLGNNRKLYYRELVARFAHHNAVLWNMGEENSWGNSGKAITDSERISYGQYFNAIDPYNHPLTVHPQGNGSLAIYRPLWNQHNYVATSMQHRVQDNINGLTKQLRNESAAAGRKWVIMMDETGWPFTYGPGSTNLDTVRKDVIWANLMAGGAGSEQILNGYLSVNNFREFEPLWQDYNHASNFFHEHLPFWQMAPDNGLTSDGGDYVLAKPGDSYAVYRKNGGSTNLDVTGGGTYSVKWYNPREGGALQNGSVTSISGSGSQNIGNPPSGGDWVALISR